MMRWLQEPAPFVWGFIVMLFVFTIGGVLLAYVFCWCLRCTDRRPALACR